MTTPSNVPPIVAPQPAEPVTPEVIATATRVVRVKSVLKNSFKTVSTAVVAGAAGGLVVARSLRNSDTDVDIDTVDSSTE